MTRALIAIAMLIAYPTAMLIYASSPSLPGGLCVTHGIDGTDTAYYVESDSASLRAVAPQTGGDRMLLTFTARGEASPPVPLADGKIRHQVCAKLRAADGCNLVYVCWRLEPKPWIQVQVKSNPGKHDATACGAAGYIQATPTDLMPVPGYRDGREHTMDAQLIGTALAVSIDGIPAWEGEVDQAATSFDGPVGIRTDNERITATLRADVDCTSVVGGE